MRDSKFKKTGVMLLVAVLLLGLFGVNSTEVYAEETNASPTTVNYINNLSIHDKKSGEKIANHTINGENLQPELDEYIYSLNDYYDINLSIVDEKLVDQKSSMISSNFGTNITYIKDYKVTVTENNGKDISNLKPMPLPIGTIYNNQSQGQRLRTIEIYNGSELLSKDVKITMNPIDTSIRNAFESIDTTKYYFDSIEVSEGFTMLTTNSISYSGKSEDITIQVQEYLPIKEEVNVETVAIPFETITQENINLPSGQSKTIQEGKEGQKEVTTTIKKDYHLSVGEPAVTEKIILEPINQIIEIGTGVLTEETTEEEVNIPYEVEYRVAEDLVGDESRVIQEGAAGKKKVITTQEYLNGQLYGEPVITEIILIEPQNKIIEVAYQFGDVDLSGEVNIQDYIKLANHLSETEKLEGLSLTLADVYQDGEVNIQDYIALANLLLSK